MPIIIAAIRTETTIFFSRLRSNGRRVLFSNLFHTIAASLVSMFIAAFIWRATGSLWQVAFYSIGTFMFLPVGFLLNGIVLRRTGLRTAYWIGAVGYNLSALIVVLFAVKGAPEVLLLGAVRGIGYGLYWGCRHYLEWQETAPDERRYFFGIGVAADWLIKIFVPIGAGWFIVLGERTGLYSVSHAYWTLVGASVLLMCATAAVISRGDLSSPAPVLRAVRGGILGNRRRMLCGAVGAADGIGFVETFLILSFLGKEGVLGTIGAAVSLATACVAYLYGRRQGEDPRHRAMIGGSASFLLCAALLASLPHPANVLAYVLLSGVATGFFSMTTFPEQIALAEEESGGDADLRYSFVIDNEIFLNIGRLMGSALVLGLALLCSRENGLLYGPLLAALLQAGFLALFLGKRSVGHVSFRTRGKTLGTLRGTRCSGP